MSYQEGDPTTAESVCVLSPEQSHEELDGEQLFRDWLSIVGTPDEPRPEPSVDPPQTNNRTARPHEITFEGVLHVNGYVAGVLRSDDGHLIVDAAGTVDGDILVPAATIHGCVRGDIHAAKQIELSGSAKVIGDIETVNLSIGPGATFEGRCVLRPSQPRSTADTELPQTNTS